MQIIKNQTNFTIRMDKDQEYVIFNPPYVSDGRCFVNFKATRASVKLLGELGTLARQYVRDNTPFIAKLEEDGYKLTTPQDKSAFERLENAPDNTPVKATPFKLDLEDDEVLVAVAPAGVVGLPTRYVGGLLDKEFVVSESSKVASVFITTPKGRKFFVGMMPTPITGVSDELDGWLAKLGGE